MNFHHIAKQIFLSMLSFAGVLAACTIQPKESADIPADPPIETEATEIGGRLALSAGDYTLLLLEDNGLWQLQIVAGSDVICQNTAPVHLITSEQESAPIVHVTSTYQSALLEQGILCASAVVQTSSGATVQITDRYRSSKDGFLLERQIQVLTDGKSNQGFASLYTLMDPYDGNVDDYSYFIPSVLYRDVNDMSINSIMSQFSDINYVKETRCGTPMAMLFSERHNHAFAIVHVQPQIRASENFYGEPYAVANSQQYGALGFAFSDGASVDFVYPSTETPRSYETGGIVQRYHTLTTGTEQTYTLGILMQKKTSYQQAMTQIYLSALAWEDPEILPSDLDSVYNATISLYNALFLRYQGKEEIFSAGLPFAANVISLDDYYTASFQIGFVGAQATIASELIRDGIQYNNERSLEKGCDILNFWTSEDVYRNTLPPSWWTPANGGKAGSVRIYPSFLRCVVDGAEGLLNACIYAKSSDLDTSTWEAAAIKIANFLVDNQNDDGSWYRAYNTSGSVCKDTSNPAYQGDSKLNTPVGVRFLCNMYNYTGDIKYYHAAVCAANYCYDALYLRLGKYVGGTPDNPNVPDKEAALFAFYAFSAVYEMTGEEKYLPALEHAAVSFMSWVYTYDFAVPEIRTQEQKHLNIFRTGGTAGWSFIATGHSSIDLFAAHGYYELTKQYLRSGNMAYQKVAALLQNNTKTAMDLNGERGYLYPGFALEACNVADHVFYTVENGVWLPWISAAFLEPMIQMEETFGTWDLFELSL